MLGAFASARDVTKQLQAQREIAEQQAKDIERLDELKRFRRLIVGRELKMIELKKDLVVIADRVDVERSSTWREPPEGKREPPE